MTASIAFVSSTRSPFQVELADAIRDSSGFDYHVLFSEDSAPQRGAHWRTGATERGYVHAYPRGGVDVAKWVNGRLRAISPSVVIVGGYHGPAFQAARNYARTESAKLGFWGEPPAPRGRFGSMLRRRVRENQLRGFDFVLCIGIRAFDAYRSLVPVGNAHLVPYGQDLSTHFAIERYPTDSPLRFLFSGRLVPRHNLGALFSSLAEVANDRPDTFSVTIAASGPGQDTLDRCLRQSQPLTRILEYERNYKTWEDRVVPFSTSDVLLYPSFHSGWGLVVPEAMAAGMLVVSTREVEAASWLVTPGVDGLVIHSDRSSIVRALHWCLDHPLRARQMGLNARVAATQATAEHVASTLAEILTTYVWSR